MKSEILRNWMKSTGMTRRELAAKCNVSERTVEGWFMKDELPRSIGLLVDYIIRDAMGKISFSLTAAEMSKLLKKMEADGFSDITEYITHIIRREIGEKR